MVGLLSLLNYILSSKGIHFHRVSVPLNILQDDIVERLEDFRLILISRAENPVTNVRIGPIVNTQVRITDDDGQPLSLSLSRLGYVSSLTSSHYHQQDLLPSCFTLKVNLNIIIHILLAVFPYYVAYSSYPTVCCSTQPCLLPLFSSMFYL